MNYPNAQYDYFIDFRDEPNRKSNIMGLAQRFLNYFNPNRWDGNGEKPDTVDGEHYQRAKIKFGDKTGDYWYLDMWYEKTDKWEVVVAFDESGDMVLRTDEINSSKAIAEMIASFLQCDYQYADDRDNIFHGIWLEPIH